MRMQTEVLLMGFGGAAAIVLLFVVVLASMGGGVVRERYASSSDAIDKQAVDHGMVPDFLPRSATEIIAERNLDLNTLNVEFSYGNDFDVSSSGLEKSDTSLPSEILEETSLGESGVDRLEVFSNVGSDRTCASHLVIDKQKRRAVYIYNIEPHRSGCY